MNWLWENRTWLFSGAGVALVSFLLWLVRRLRTTAPSPRSESAASVASIENALVIASPIASGSNISQTVQNIFPSSSPPPDTRIGETHPTPEEIREHIANLPPYGQAEAAEHYVGLPVRWRVRLSTVERDSGEMCTVTLNISPARFLSVVCKVRTSDYPRLRVAKQDTPIEVSGLIERIQSAGLIIKLRDVKMIFLDE